MTRILIVDDKADNLAYLQSLLASPDCTVESAHDGAEALLKARQSPPDVVISDLLMPVMDGYTLLRHWKADARLNAIPFVVYTATYSDPEDQRLALKLGADAFIVKPTDPEHLLAQLHAAVAGATSGLTVPHGIPSEDDGPHLELFNERLIRKLEEKTLQLEAVNRTLQQDIVEREQSALAQHRMAATQVAILNALPAHIALVDAEGVIVSVNEAWQRFATANVLPSADFGVGQSYLAVCEQAAGDCSDEAKEAAAGIRQVLQGEAKSFALEYPCHSPTERRWFRVMVTPLDEERRLGAVIMHVNITERRLSEEALRASEREFRDLAEAVPQIVWTTQPDGWTTYLNQQWTKYTGLTLEDSLRLGWITSFHPDEQQQAWDAWQHATATASSYSIESRLRRADGTYRWWLVRGVPLKNEAGTVLKWFVTCTDIHDLKLAEVATFRANRALKMLSACNEAVLLAGDERELLRLVCQTGVEMGGYRMAWVGYAQDDEARSITPVAYAGAEEGYFSEIRISWDEDDPLGQGPGGRVIRSGEPVVCPDFSRDPTFSNWPEAAERRGYRGVIMLPLREQQHTFGCLGLYSAEVNEPTADELQLLRELADDLAFGIVHLRAGLVQQRLQTAIARVATAVSATSGTAFYEQLARNMAEAVGAQAAFVSQLRSGQPPSASTLAVVVDGTLIDNFDYVIKGTPCEKLAGSESCVITRHVTREFPQAERLAALGAHAYVGHRLDGSTGQPLGHLFVVFREPLDDAVFVTSTMRIFATRAAFELERAIIDERVREQAALIDQSRDAIIVRGLDHRITFWSKGAERLYGWSADEARGRFLPELLAPDPAIFAEASRTVLEIGEWSGEVHKRTRNGTVLTLNVRLTLVRDADGQPRSILGSDTDVTEQKRIEAQFLRAQRMESVGTLAGGIAHDLNNVFAPIMMSLELLSARLTDPDSAELISILTASTQHGADMVRQLLAFARGLEGRRIELQIRHLIKEVEKITADTFLKHINVRTNIQADLWTVVGDPTQVHQVLMNLCVNARDAMPDGGTLVLSAENRVIDAHYAALNPEATAGPYVFLQVEDTGTGIPPEILDKIFDPFFTTKDVGKGTGLGLSTSLGIVRSHGGFFRVYSEPGKGTRFKVYLPAQTGTAEEAAARVAAELPRGDGELILVVDDEASVRAITRATLEQFGYKTLLASDGAEAVALYATRHAEIAAVITDMTMPVMDGTAAIRVLRRINPAVRIIAASGLAISGELARAAGVDIEHFISKPYAADRLLKVLRHVLDGGRAPA